MTSIKERNAAFDAAKVEVLKFVPAMFQSYVSDSDILAVSDAALNAAEKVHGETATAPKPAATPTQKS